MFELTTLPPDRIDLCQRIVSSNAFYMIVADALLRRKALSVVRMGDGERSLCEMLAQNRKLQTTPIHCKSEEWMSELGCLGISHSLLAHRMNIAANECDYFAPSVSGIFRQDYDLYSQFKARKYYVDNFFVNAWTEEMKIQLFQEAGHVLFIHRNVSAADAIQIRAKYALGVKVTYLNLNSWEQAESVIQKAKSIDAPLVLFSAGPAGKYIGPRIAHASGAPKVTLDLGNTSNYWLLGSLQDVAQKSRDEAERAIAEAERIVAA